MLGVRKCNQCGKEFKRIEGRYYGSVGPSKFYCKNCYEKISARDDNDDKLRDNLIVTGSIILIFTFLIFWIAFGLIGFFGGLILGCILLLAGLLQPKKEHQKELINALKSHSSENPTEVLKLRYAKGEITKEEYEQMKKDIEG